MVAEAHLETEKVDKVLTRLYSGLGTASLMAAMGTIHLHFTEKSEKMFESEQDPDGNPWTPLTEATKEIRINLGYPPGPINTRSGRLRDYMVSARPDILGHSDGVVSYAYPSRGFPADDLMKRMEQAAGKNPKAPTPREVVGINETDVAYVLATLGASIYGGGLI